MFRNVLKLLPAAPAGWRRLTAFGLALLLAAAVLTGLSGGPASAASFLDAGLTDVPADKKVVVAHPQPVQVLFQFDTKGSPNSQATKIIKPFVMDAVKASGLFSDVGDGPAANGAVLSITIDNVLDPDEMKAATAKGVLTGATFFIAGSTVKDHYNCTIEYLGGPNAAKLTRTAKHAIITQLGLINSAPENAVKVDGGARGAVMIMARQIVSNPLNDLGGDPAFATPATPATPPADPAAAPAPATPATPVTSASPAAPAQPTTGTPS